MRVLRAGLDTGLPRPSLGGSHRLSAGHIGRVSVHAAAARPLYHNELRRSRAIRSEPLEFIIYNATDASVPLVGFAREAHS